MSRAITLIGIVALSFVVACGSDDEKPEGASGTGGAGGAGAGATGGTGGASGSGGAGGSAGTGGSAAGGAGTGGSSGSSAGTGGSSGSGAGTGGDGGTAGTSGGTGGDGGTAGSSAGTGGTAGIGGSGGTGGVSTEYPPGPYGKTVGATIENYQFNGYVNDAGTALSNTLPKRDYSLDDARKSGARYALIHLAAFYCAGCRSAAADLGDLSAPVQAAGGRVIEVMFSGTAGAPTDNELDSWVTAYDLKVSLVAPKGTSSLAGGASDREHAYIVDLSTMKIVWTVFGSYGPTTNSSAKQGLAEMRRLMGI
jgi:hypothetical protein